MHRIQGAGAYNSGTLYLIWTYTNFVELENDSSVFPQNRTLLVYIHDIGISHGIQLTRIKLLILKVAKIKVYP